jgi:outer membrane protein OmpA-like peptidoglycan-associated protein
VISTRLPLPNASLNARRDTQPMLRPDITVQALQIVDQAAKNAAPMNVTQLTVTGHADTVGSDAYNMRLSRRRAESAAAELEKDGIPSRSLGASTCPSQISLLPGNSRNRTAELANGETRRLRARKWLILVRIGQERTPA